MARIYDARHCIFFGIVNCLSPLRAFTLSQASELLQLTMQVRIVGWSRLCLK
jgi:hypothetical protein